MKTELKCPYCNIALIVTDKHLDKKSVSLRCKYCYGVFNYIPYDNRIHFTKNRNYYEIYGIDKEADIDSIKTRYKILALRFHPDRHKDKEYGDGKMKQINLIYSILGDSNLRKRYDSSIQYDVEMNEVYSDYEPPVYIYQDSIEIKDSSGMSSIIRQGDRIYFTTKQYFSVFHKKIPLRTKAYYDVIIQKVFNPKHKSEYESVLGRKMDKEPIFVVNFGLDEMIIYKEEFNEIWISQKTLNRKDTKKVIFVSAIIAALTIFYVLHLNNTYIMWFDEKGGMEILEQKEYFDRVLKEYEEEGVD